MKVLAKSRISIINKQEPKLRYTVWDIAKQKWRTVEEDNYSLRIGDELRILSSSCYVYRSGVFYIAIARNNKVFTLDENDLIIKGVFESQLLAFNKNETPVFQSKPVFNLFD